MKRIRVLLLALVLFGAGSLAYANAQDSNDGWAPLDLPCTTNVSIKPLGQAVPTDAPEYALSLLELKIEPGGGFTAHTHPPTLIVSVESGNFGLTPLEHDMTVMIGGKETPVAMGQEVVLHAGDWVIERGMIHSMRAIGDEPVVALISGYTDASQALVQCVDAESTPTS